MYLLTPNDITQVDKELLKKYNIKLGEQNFVINKREDYSFYCSFNQNEENFSNSLELINTNWSEGKYSGGVNFTEGDYVISESNFTDYKNNLSWGMWININSNFTDWNVLEKYEFQKNKSLKNFGLLGLRNGNKLSCEVFDNHNTKLSSGWNAESYLNEWTHVFCVFNGKTICIYENGKKQKCNTNNSFGKIKNDFGRIMIKGLVGLMDEVVIYNKTLNQLDIDQLIDKLVIRSKIDDKGFNIYNLTKLN